MNLRGAVAVAVTGIGVALMAYAFAVGWVRGHIGSPKQWTPDSIAAILGWFMIIIGPAISARAPKAR